MARLAVLGVVALAAVFCGSPTQVQADQPEDPAKFESDPLMGGPKNIMTRFKLAPKWDRIRKMILDGQRSELRRARRVDSSGPRR